MSATLRKGPFPRHTIPIERSSDDTLRRSRCIERFDLATGRRELSKSLVPPGGAGGYLVDIAVTRDGNFWANGFFRPVGDLWQVTDLAMR